MTTGTMRDLRVWDAARLMAVEGQRAADGARVREAAALWAQTRSAAESVGANVAEGCGRSTTTARRRFFVIALGSARGTHHHLRCCRDYDLIAEAQVLRLIGLADAMRRMLEALIATRGSTEG